MVIGCLLRTEKRGLGYQSRAFQRHMDASPLVISIPNRSEQVCPADLSLYPDSPVARVHTGWRLEADVVRPWLETIDVLWTAETFYSDDLTAWAREQGVATAIHANPEFTPPSLAGYGLGSPAAWWSATPWRLGAMPSGTQVVPWPVERVPQVEPHDGPCRWVHVVGREAIGDRNGTTTVLAALQLLREPCEVTLVTQERALPGQVVAPRHVTWRVVTGGVDSPADLYADADALMYPRRYGGLSLVTSEAMAAGLAVVMPDVSPNTEVWPVCPMPALKGPLVSTAAGPIRSAEVDPPALAAAMDTFADPAVRHEWQARARAWSVQHSWEVLAGEYRRRLGELRTEDAP